MYVVEYIANPARYQLSCRIINIQVNNVATKYVFLTYILLHNPTINIIVLISLSVCLWLLSSQDIQPNSSLLWITDKLHIKGSCLTSFIRILSNVFKNYFSKFFIFQKKVVLLTPLLLTAEWWLAYHVKVLDILYIQMCIFLNNVGWIFNYLQC